jgi:hypothetical protein
VPSGHVTTLRQPSTGGLVKAQVNPAGLQPRCPASTVPIPWAHSRVRPVWPRRSLAPARRLRSLSATLGSVVSRQRIGWRSASARSTNHLPDCAKNHGPFAWRRTTKEDHYDSDRSPQHTDNDQCRRPVEGESDAGYCRQRGRHGSTPSRTS